MLADFYIPRLSNGMNIAVQKNHLSGHMSYKSPNSDKKRRPDVPMAPVQFQKKMELNNLPGIMAQ